VETTEKIGDNLVGRRLKSAVDKEKERLVGGTAQACLRKKSTTL
jgi:hypothetical protein